MKKRLFLLVMTATLLGVAHAQPAGNGGGEKLQTNRVYHVFANSESNPDSLQARNALLASTSSNNRSILAGLGAAILASYTNKLIQGTVNLTSNAIGLAVKTVSGWIHKNKNDRENWLRTAERQNHFKQTLQTQTFIDDFYYGNSTSGALDPMNMKFNGFGCLCYMRPDANPPAGGGPDTAQVKPEYAGQDLPLDFRADNQGTPEIWEFYVSCKLRDDSLGRAHIVNHSKFYVELDQLVFDTRHSSLPNDSLPRRVQRSFDFNKRKNLTFTVNVKVFSSWVNEAIMLTNNQQIGEFNIIAHIDSSDLNSDGVFVYVPELHREKVNVTGESFIVPRSYTGTADAPSWGSGQYRLEMTVSEDCAMNLPYYQKPPRKSSAKSAELAAANPAQAQSKNKIRWDDKKWKPEWKEMQAGRKGQTVFSSAWQSVTTAYVNRDWVQELVSPLTTAVSEQEKLALSKLLNVETGNAQKGGNPAGGQGGQTGGAPSGQQGSGIPSDTPPRSSK